MVLPAHVRSGWTYLSSSVTDRRRLMLKITRANSLATDTSQYRVFAQGVGATPHGVRADERPKQAIVMGMSSGMRARVREVGFGSAGSQFGGAAGPVARAGGRFTRAGRCAGAAGASFTPEVLDLVTACALSKATQLALSDGVHPLKPFIMEKLQELLPGPVAS